MKQMGNTLEEQTVASFQIPDNEEFMAANSIVLEMYGNTGSCEKRFYYVDSLNAEIEGVEKTGWYDADAYDENYGYTDDDYCNNAVIPFGCGVIITSSEADSKITFAGEVVADKAGKKDFDLFGYDMINWTGNASPVDFKMADLAIPTDQAFMAANSIVLEVYGTTGSCEHRYYFVDELNAEIEGVTTPGWYDADAYDENFGYTDDDLRNSDDLPSAQMVIITNSEADTTISIPTAL